MSHTRGPWEIDEDDFCVYAKSNDGVSDVLVASVQESGSSPQKPRFGEDEANLTLIAAAPELLAALKDCRGWLVALCDSNALGDRERAILRAAEQAIAKAEGRGE